MVLFTAETLHDWGVVNRVLPGGELLDKARRFAARLASGPTRRTPPPSGRASQADHGTRGADERVAELTSHLFDTEDMRERGALLEHGPGKAGFTGQ